MINSNNLISFTITICIILFKRYHYTNGTINSYGINATAVAPFGAASLATQLVNKIFEKGSQLVTGILAVLPSVGVSTSNHGVSKYISVLV